MVNLVLENSTPAASASGAAPSKWIKIASIGALLLAAVGFAVWWFFIRHPKAPAQAPASQAPQKGSNWTCQSGTKGNYKTMTVCASGDAKAGDLCEGGSGDTKMAGICSYPSSSPSYRSSSNQLTCETRTTKSAQECSDLCFKDTTDNYIYSLWNKTDNACVCRPDDKTIFWDRCATKDESSGWVTCASNEAATPNLTPCATLCPPGPEDKPAGSDCLYALNDKALGSLDGTLAQWPAPSIDACVAEAVLRNKQGDQGEAPYYTIWHPNTYTCEVKSWSPTRDAKGVDCGWTITSDKDPANAGNSLLISPALQGSDLTLTEANFVKLPHCLDLVTVQVKGDLTVNERLRPRHVTDDETQEIKTVQACAKKCAESNDWNTPGNYGRYPVAQPASMLDNGQCWCFDYPQRKYEDGSDNWAVCASPDGKGSRDMYVLRSGTSTVAPLDDKRYPIEDVPECDANVWDPLTIGRCDDKDLHCNNESSVGDCKNNLLGATRFFAPQGDGSTSCICVPCQKSGKVGGQDADPKLPNDFNADFENTNERYSAPWMDGQCIDGARAHASGPDQVFIDPSYGRIRCNPATKGLGTLCANNSDCQSDLVCSEEKRYDEGTCKYIDGSTGQKIDVTCSFGVCKAKE
jgi:hypothetical protein